MSISAYELDLAHAQGEVDEVADIVLERDGPGYLLAVLGEVGHPLLLADSDNVAFLE
jgi:hypothetical protein